MAISLGKRLRPDVIEKHFTRSHSSRLGAHTQIFTLHTTEGVMRLQDRGPFWDSTFGTVRASSSHVGVGSPLKGQAGQSARYVHDADKAWTQANYNPVARSIEIEGFAGQAAFPDDTYREVARWLAEWSLETGIPLRRAITIGGGVQRTGVASHKQLGLAGGGHSDPGNFKIGKAIRLARRYKRARILQREKD